MGHHGENSDKLNYQYVIHSPARSSMKRARAGWAVGNIRQIALL